MTEFTHRHQSVASGTNATDRISAVRAVTPVSANTARTDVSIDVTSQQADAAGQPGEDVARARADYAKVNRDIANVIDSLSVQGPRKGPTVVAEAENALLSLLPQPSMILPLPPADEDMVAFVTQVSQSIVRQAAQTRAALSAVVPAVVDAATAA